MSDHFKLRGLKFYQFQEDSSVPTILRLIDHDEVAHKYNMMTCDTYQEMSIPEEELETKWVKLNPDGIMVFSLVTAMDNQGEEVPDIMVNLHIINKNENGLIQKIPYCTCRQAVIDIFALMQDNTRYIAGMCISRDSCPPELNYSGCLAYKNMTRHMEVAVYMDDHLDDILKLFKHRPYDQRLELIKSRDKTGIEGYQTNLHDFLHFNYFMYDFHAAFCIHELDFETFDFEDQNTNRVLTNYIISNKQEVPTKFYPVPFSKYLDLSDIKRKYILVCPNSFKYPNGNITLLAYDVSKTISYRDIINSGKSPSEAKKEIMQQLGWS